MTTVAVLGASGRIARHAVEMLGGEPDVEQVLVARDATRLDVPDNAGVVTGDVLDREVLDAAIRGADVVYANLAGDLEEQARAIITAMEATGAPRLVFVTALGIYDEVPGRFGEWNRAQIGSMLGPYRAAADAIEDSGLDYTILRPAWLTDDHEVDYEVTQRTEPFRGTEVSRRSVADLVVSLIRDPSRASHANLGVNKPNSDGDTPSFM